MLDKIHYIHMGIEKSKKRTRETLFWPRMNAEIEDLIKNCASCLKFQRENPKEPLMPKEVPDGPWHVLGLDLFRFRNSDWLFVIDYFSKFVEVAKLQNIEGITIVLKFKSMFSRFAIPELVYSDNGTHFSNVNSRKFAAE